MELTGDLSDFALTDILQILALSRKTGTLSLESASVSGRIIIEQGRIIYASVEPGETLSDQLVRENKIGGQVMNELRAIGLRATGVWTLESLLIESGVISREELEAAVKRHIQNAVAHLVGLEKGRFGIELNQSDTVESLTSMKLSGGIEVGEVLLEAAKDRDERARIGEYYDPAKVVEWNLRESSLRAIEAASDNDDVFSLFKKENGTGLRDTSFEELDLHRAGDFSRNGKGRRNHASALLFSMLAELRSHSFEAEVSLLIMRYASEFVARGILFVVKGDEVCGLGQFGVECKGNGKSADSLVREIKIPLGDGSVFDSIVDSGNPFIGTLPECYWHGEMLGKIGGNCADLSIFALPLMCNDQAIFIFYGDNYPGLAELTGVEELTALVNQASIVMEKMVLQRMVARMREEMRA